LEYELFDLGVESPAMNHVEITQGVHYRAQDLEVDDFRTIIG
jgi:hypothetical protein